MSESEEMTTTQLGGKKKSNGHKANCMCPICKNMMKKMKSKRGGGDEEMAVEEPMMEEEMKMEGGKKKSNGHKANCKCPICKNMMKKKTIKRGGEGDIETGDLDADIMENNNELIEDINMEEEVNMDDDKEYKKMDAAEKGELGLESVGGTRKRKRKTTKKRKTRRTRKNRKSRRKNRKH